MAKHKASTVPPPTGEATTQGPLTINASRSSRVVDFSTISPGANTAAIVNHVPHSEIASTNAVAESALRNSHVSPSLTEKIRELLRLAQEQGYLTYNDVNECLADRTLSPEEMDEIIIQLRNLEVEIVDQAEVDRIKVAEPEEEDEKSRLDILDDPVRMYLKQMGQVPLLTREQEVEISKRIEDAENQIKETVYSFGFAGKEHIALAEKLLSEPPKERFDRVIIDKKIDSRDTHLRALRKLVKTVRE